MPLTVIQKRITAVFLLLTVTDLAAIIGSYGSIHYLAKPLLIPALITLLLYTRLSVPGKTWLLAGLFFSWMGDVFLLFEKEYATFFIFGLASFLITHVFYIIFFLRISSPERSLFKKLPFLLLLVPVYGIALVWFLYPKLGDLKLPVMVYAAMICTMLLCSLHVFNKINSPANRWYVAGALLFVSSDSLLAVDKFYQQFSFANVLIMLSYCAAQFAIVRGYTVSK